MVQLPCGCAYAAALERRRFKQCGLGILRYLAVEPAHYARYAYALFGICYKQHIRRYGALLAVKRGDNFVFIRVSYNYVAILYACKIKRMHRVTVFNKHIVCDIDYVVYRAHAYCTQALLHPHRRWLYVKLRNHARGVSWAKLSIEHGNGGIIVNVAFALYLPDNRLPELLAKGCGGLAAHAYYALAICAVRRKLYIENYVVKANGLLYALAKLMFFMQYHYSVDLGAGIVGLRKAKLTA